MLNVAEELVVEEPVGKRLASHLYTHRSGVRHLPDELKILVAQALLVAGEFDYTLVKIAHDESHVCLLRYPTFDTNPHPELKYSIKVLLPGGHCCISDYTNSANPPVLHRKETFVTPEYPLYAVFAALSQAEEKHGLLGRHDISHRKQWRVLLASKKLSIKGHVLVEKK